MSLVPQNLYFYDQLPLFLAATTTNRRLLLIILSWAAWWGGRLGCETPWYCGPETERWVILLIYVPATAMALLGDDEMSWLRRRMGLEQPREAPPEGAAPRTSTSVL